MKHLSVLPRVAFLLILAGFLLSSSAQGVDSNGPIGKGKEVRLNGGEGPNETDGTIDLPFDAGTFGNGWIVTSALQPDHKLLIGGLFRTVHGVFRQGIARLNEDGTLDSSFDPGTGDYTEVEHLVVLSDGKIMVFGHTWPPNLFPPLAVLCVRLNSDGSVDPTFRINRIVAGAPGDDGAGNATYPGTIRSVVEQDDGKLIVVGSFSYIITGPGKSVARACIARFNADGSFDASFDPGTGFISSSNITETTRVVLQRNGVNKGKVIVQGLFDTFNDEHPAFGLARLNTDGSFDNNFYSYDGNGDSSLIKGLLLQSDDQIILFGSFTSAFEKKFSGIVRLTDNGFVDENFRPDLLEDYGDPAVVSAVAQQASGKLIVGGYFHSLNTEEANNVVRLEMDGSHDTSFNAYAAGPSGYFVDTIVIHPDSPKIFVAGYFSSYQGALRNNMAWLNSNGSVDTTFAGMSGVRDYDPNIYAIATQPDGKIVVGGFFSTVNGLSRYNLVRLNPDSSIDPSFVTQGTDGSVRALQVLPDGKILIAGFIRAVDGVPCRRIARLNSDGTFDFSFNVGAGPDDGILALANDASGSVYVGGVFTFFDGSYASGITKLDSSGARDPMFNAISGGTEGTNHTVYAITPPDDTGNIVIGGNFTQYHGNLARRIARLNATTGELDFGFNPGGAAFNGAVVLSLAKAADGKYYAGGIFSNYNGVARRNLARLNSDGSLDGSFVGPSNFYAVYALAASNEKVVAGGLGPLTRLNGDGSVDASFLTGSNVGIPSSSPFYFGGPIVTALANQSDGKLLFGGLFNRYDGHTRFCLARLGNAVTGGVSGLLGNISTRLPVETGNNSLIGGFIVTGTQPKRVIIRAIGPSLGSLFPEVLTDPTLELRDSSGGVIASNDNWRTDQEAEIISTLIPPTSDLESAIVATLPANGAAYTAVIRGASNGTGVGLAEVYDLDPAADSKLGNISTRGFVQTNNDVLIGGVIVLGQSPLKVIVRAIGPSLPIAGSLEDPTLELFNGDGVRMGANDNWRSDQADEIAATGVPPSNDLESAVVRDLAPGNYTAVVRGVNDTTGVALVEVYGLNN